MQAATLARPPTPPRRALAAWRMMRPANAAITAASVYVASLLAGASWTPGAPIVAGMGAAFFFAAAGNVRNDVTDIDIDRVAHPRRALVTGEVSLRGAQGLAVGLYGASLVLGALVSAPAFVLVLLAVPVMEGYERAWKHRGLAGNLAIALLAAAPFVLGGLAAGHVGPALLSLALLAALATLGREVLKDVEDEAADRGHRVTLPMRLGAARAGALAAASLVLAALLSPLPYLLERVLAWSYLPAVGLADACFLGAAAIAVTRVAHAAKAQRLAKAGMVLALAALLVGRAQGGGPF